MKCKYSETCSLEARLSVPAEHSGTFLECLIKIYAVIPTRSTAGYAKLLQHIPILPFSHFCFHSISLTISLCADVLCSADVLSLLPPTVLSHTHAHTPLLLMNEWEKTLISIMHCSSFSLHLKQSLLFSPRSFSLTFSHMSARAC